MELLEALGVVEDAPTMPCKLGRLLESADEDVREKLLFAVVNLSPDILAARLRRTTTPVGATTIKLHKRKVCGCFV